MRRTTLRLMCDIPGNLAGRCRGRLAERESDRELPAVQRESSMCLGCEQELAGTASAFKVLVGQWGLG